MRTARTTLILDGALLKRAKALASQSGTTLSALVNDALSVALSSSPPRPAPPFKMVVFGSKRKVDHAPADLRAFDEDDLRRLGR